MTRLHDVRSAIAQELPYWPGVGVDFAQQSKHDRALFTFGDKTRFITLASTPSCHRSALNTIRDMRKELQTLGAQRVDKLPRASRKGRIVPVAKLGITKRQVAFVVPGESPIFHHFADKNNHPRHYWTIEMRAQPGGAEPLLAVVRAPDPGGKPAGVAKGSVLSLNGSFTLCFQATTMPVVARHGYFGISPIELVEETKDALVFRLPTLRKAIKLRGAVKEEFLAELAAEQAAEQATVDPTPPVPIWAAKPSPEREPEPQIETDAVAEPEVMRETTMPMPTLPGPQPVTLKLEVPREKVSLERAIAVINAYKDKMGHSCRMRITEGGYLSVTAVHGR